MRVELLYAPGCTSFVKARKTLEMAIADERLPDSYRDGRRIRTSRRFTNGSALMETRSIRRVTILNTSEIC